MRIHRGGVGVNLSQGRVGYVVEVPLHVRAVADDSEGKHDGLKLSSSRVGAAGQVTDQNQTVEHETKTKSTAYRLYSKWSTHVSSKPCL